MQIGTIRTINYVGSNPIPYDGSSAGAALEQHTAPLLLLTGDPSVSQVLPRAGVRDRLEVVTVPARAHRSVHPSPTQPSLPPDFSRTSVLEAAPRESFVRHGPGGYRAWMTCAGTTV